MVTPRQLLAALPPFQNSWVVIERNQDTRDIIREVLTAHKLFASHYDRIAGYFDAPTVPEIVAKVDQFLRANVRYREEPERRQTVALPGGLLTRLQGDCKHYAGFSAGIIDALRRRGRPVSVFYRFASYRPLDPVPHHVFAVAVDRKGREFWIDPTPEAGGASPVWQLDKKINSMALVRNIAGKQIAGPQLGQAVGSQLGIKIDGDNNLGWERSGKYSGVFNPYLGLGRYKDVGGASALTNWAALADTINQEINRGPSPGHRVTADFVRWVYDQNIRSWNFYYPGGVRPGFSAAGLLPLHWPRLELTPDGRLTLTDTQKLDDYQNAEIHLLTAWAQDLVNKHATKPYPVKPEHLKRFSQGLEGGPGERNLLNEARGDSIFTEIGRAVASTVKLVARGVLKVVAAGPRNAFLGLVGLNVFNMAANLSREIAGGAGEKIFSKWSALGGNPDKLANTIKDGATKPAVLGAAQVGAEPATSTAALLAAAAPIIAALLQFLNKDGKLNHVALATKQALEKAFPGQQFEFINGVLVDPATGKEIEIIGDRPLGVSTRVPLSPVLAAAAAGAAAWFLQPRPKKMLWPLAAAAGAYLLTKPDAVHQTNA